MIRVVLAGDRPVPLAGLRSHLARHDFSVVDGAPPGDRTFAVIGERRPDVVLLDSSTAADGLHLCYRLTQLARPQRVVLHVIRPTPRLQVAAWVSGASGLASAGTSATGLAEIVRSAAAGRRTLPRPPIAAVRAAGAQLAPPELSIFGMRMHGVPCEDITSALRLDPLDVERRTRSLVERLSSDDDAPGGDETHPLDPGYATAR